MSTRAGFWSSNRDGDNKYFHTRCRTPSKRGFKLFPSLQIIKISSFFFSSCWCFTVLSTLHRGGRVERMAQPSCWSFESSSRFCSRLVSIHIRPIRVHWHYPRMTLTSFPPAQALFHEIAVIENRRLPSIPLSKWRLNSNYFSAMRVLQRDQ